MMRPALYARRKSATMRRHVRVRPLVSFVLGVSGNRAFRRPPFCGSRHVRVDAGADHAGPRSVRRRHPPRRVVVGRREPVQVCEGHALLVPCLRLIPTAWPTPSSAPRGRRARP
jgi:hypothetical protein